MADGPSLLQFPFAAGIKEGTRDELLEPGQGWATLENGRQDHVGGYSTRNGFAAFTTTRLDLAASSPTAGYKLFADRKTPCRITEDPSIEVYSSTAARWKSLGRVPECAVRLIDLPSMGTSATIEDVEVCNGYIAVTWLSGTTAYAAVIDATTGAIVRSPEAVTTLQAASPPLLTYAGTRFFLVAYNAANQLDCWYLATVNPAAIEVGWTAMAALATDLYDTVDIPYAVCNVGAKCALFYTNTSGGSDQATLKTFDSTGVLASSNIATNSITPTRVDVDGEAGTTIWLAWDESTAIKVSGRDATTIANVNASADTMFSVSVSATNVGIAQNRTTPTKARVWANELPVASALNAKMRGVTTSGGAAAGDGAAVTVPAAKMVGKPTMYSGRYYALFFGADSANSQDNVVVCDWSENVTYLRPVASFVPGLMVESAGGHVKLRLSGSTAYTAVGIKRSGVADGTALAELDFASTKRWQPAAHGNSLYLSGGVPSYFDGARVAEAGFLYRPMTPTCTNAGSGVTGTFRYIAVYEEVDADGNWHQSGVSSPSDAKTVTDDAITVSTTPLSISARLGSTSGARTVRVAWYRTNGTAGTGVYCRLGTSINDTSATTVSYVDTDTNYAMTGAKLYSQPGVIGTALDKRPPPHFTALVSYNGVLVGASGSDVWYSGQDVSGEGTWFSPIFQVPVPGDGDITALWVQDGTLFVAKRRDIYALNGEPPSDNGMSGGLGSPRRLAVDCGCIETRSPCVTAIGTFFQSERGIELLSRAQTVEWIGGDVQDTVAAYPVCTSITVEPASNTVLVELAASEASGLVSGNGRTLVYDLALRQWVSTDRRKSAAGTADKPSQSACMAYTGSAYRYCWIDAAGSVQYETPGTYTHADGTIIAKLAVSPWVKSAGPQGLQHVNRAMLLAKYHTAHDLEMSFAYDYSASYKTARTFTNATVSALVATIPNMQLEHGLHDDARCESVRVKLQDVTPSSGSLGTGQGATWIALAFEVVPQVGAYRLPDSAR